jgi:PAS domain S-box-containing protein
MRAAAMPVLFAFAYLVAGQVGYALVDHPGGSAVIWPPNGLYLAALLLAPRRRWWALVAAGAAASFAASLLYGRSPSLAVLYFLGNTAEVGAGALLVTVVAGGRPRVGTVRGALALVLVPAVAGLAVSAVVRAAAVLLGAATFGTHYWVWWAGSALGVVVVAPAVLAWADPRETQRMDPRRWIEAAAVALAHAAAAAACAVGGPGSHFANELLLVPPMLWTALRLGTRGATLSVLATSVTVVLLAGRGHGLLARAATDPGVGVLSLQVFLVLLALPVLVVAAATAERGRSVRLLARGEARLRGALRAARLWRYATDRSSDPLVIIGADGGVLYANRAFGEVVDLPAGALQRRKAWTLVRGGTEPVWSAYWDTVRAAGKLTQEEWIPRRDEGPRPYEIQATHVRLGGEEYVVQLHRDLSDRRQAEAAARLAGVGTLAAGVAHEINNPLAWVSANLQAVDEALQALAGRPDGAARAAAEAGSALADARAGVQRVSEIVRDLKAFSREQEGVGPVSVGRAMQVALAIGKQEIRHRAQLEVGLPADLPAVLGNQHRLEQVFLNLLLNAAQAIPAGQAGRHRVTVEMRVEGGEVVTEVSDTGVGMSPQVRARAFEPFFTTKPVGKGTGLGLSVSHGIVQQLGGRIELDSEPGRGTRVRVILPVTGAPAPAGDDPAEGPPPSPPEPPVPSMDDHATPPPRPSPAPSTGARVLVIDDEELVATAIRRLLRGHQVEAVPRARDALSRATDGERWDVVFCDLMMPDMSGMELHQRLQRDRPDLASRFVFITGGAFTDEARIFLEERARRWLGKPFDAARLRLLVEEVLGELGPA